MVINIFAVALLITVFYLGSKLLKSNHENEVLQKMNNDLIKIVNKEEYGINN